MVQNRSWLVRIRYLAVEIFWKPTCTNVLWIRNWRTLLHMQRAAGGRHGRDVENMRVRNNPVNNHSDPIRNNGALGFFEEVSNKKRTITTR